MTGAQETPLFSNKQGGAAGSLLFYPLLVGERLGSLLFYPLLVGERGGVTGVLPAVGGCDVVPVEAESLLHLHAWYSLYMLGTLPDSGLQAKAQFKETFQDRNGQVVLGVRQPSKSFWNHFLRVSQLQPPHTQRTGVLHFAPTTVGLALIGSGNPMLCPN